MQSDSMNDDNTSNSAHGPDSSRASTQRDVDPDAISNRSIDRDALAEYMRRRGARPDEPEKEEDGSLALTNKYLYTLIQSDKRLYYRTPELNEKLYLHYKGFHKIKNLEQFTDLKCLYFEGNGCKSMLGMEKNVLMRCLFIQENVITDIEGLDNMSDLRQLDVSNNIISHVQGLEKLITLDNLNLKANRLGQKKDSCIDCIKGLLDCPSITSLDISQNYLKDPAIVDEVLVKMPNLKVLYC